MSSPPGGPTIVAIEVPCALSSQKISPTQGRADQAAAGARHRRRRRGRLGTELLEELLTQRPDVAVIDVRLPPTFTDEGLRVALEARRQLPGLPVLVLSQYVEQLYARELLSDQGGAVGYLLKDRVFSDEAFVEALRTVAGGGTVLDPEVIAKLLRRRARRGADHRPVTQGARGS